MMNNPKRYHARMIVLLLAASLGLIVDGVRLTQVRAAAGTLHVTNTDDSGAGSLRQAIADAAPGETIDFRLSGCPCTITLTSGELEIDKNLTIQGPGANLLTISGNNVSRVFFINGGLTSSPAVKLDALTIAHGRVSGGDNSDNKGGGIFNNNSFLTITNCTISGNSVLGGNASWNYGGGIFNTGFVAVTDSTLSDNSVLGVNGNNFGGGIYNYFGTVAVTGSTLARNAANDAGGATDGGGICNGCLFRDGARIFYGSGDLELTNSTLSGNSLSGAGRSGGGIFNSSTVTITNCTIADNLGNYGGGIYNRDGGSAKIRNTIIAGNTGIVGTPDDAPDARGVFQSQGHNLIGKGDGSSGLTNGVNDDRVGAIAAPLFPNLGPLSDNGGPTQTMALLSESPAIDAGDNCVAQNPGCLATPLTTDQRGAGFNRLVADAVDIGAYEAQAYEARCTLAKDNWPGVLPGVPAGATYPTRAFAVTGAVGTVNWSVTDGALPNGLMLSSTTGANITLSGTPTNSGTFDFTLNATNGPGCLVSQMYSVAVSCGMPTLSYTNKSLGVGKTALFYPSSGPSDNLGVSSIVRQSVAPSTGLELAVNNTTGALSVLSATIAGTYLVEVAATNICGQKRVASFAVTATCPTTTLSTLANGQAGVPYNRTITMTPMGTYSFAVIAGALPPGLMLNETTGAVTGTPTVTGTFNFTVKATAASGCMGTKSYSLVISCPPVTITPSVLPAAKLGAAYHQTLTVAPAGSYTFAVNFGSLPPGMTLNPTTGLLSGTPTMKGSYYVTIRAGGFGTCSGARSYMLVVM